MIVSWGTGYCANFKYAWACWIHCCTHTVLIDGEACLTFIHLKPCWNPSPWKCLRSLYTILWLQ